jgi:hypothetical protein
MKQEYKTSLQKWLIEIISQPMSGLSADIVSVNMGEWVKTSDSFNFCFLCLGGRLVYEHLSKDANFTPKLKVTKEEIDQLFPRSLMKIESLAGCLITGEKDVDTLPLFFTHRWPAPWHKFYALTSNANPDFYNFFFEVISSIDTRVNEYFQSKTFIQAAICYCLLDELTEDDNGTLTSLWKLEWYNQSLDEYKAEVISHFRERHSTNIGMLVKCYLKALAS